MIIPALSCDGRECSCRAARSWWDTGPVLVAAKAAFNHTPAGADGIGVEDLPIIVAMITHYRLQGRGVLDRPPARSDLVALPRWPDFGAPKRLCKPRRVDVIGARG